MWRAEAPEAFNLSTFNRDGYFSRGDLALFRPIVDARLYHDPYFLLADHQSYVDSQTQVGFAYRDKEPPRDLLTLGGHCAWREIAVP
ncbi:MAG: glycogen/starch/alpha-glucan phosphorylase [Burkholderiales bacterium]|nr:glycogen/starch/alpha-glucan phosphorylase [Burkholderiales bacterium]